MADAEGVADRALGGVQPDPVVGADIEVLSAEVEGLRVELVPGDRSRRGRSPRPTRKGQVDRRRDLVRQVVITFHCGLEVPPGTAERPWGVVR
jgi:hypothetical protein